MTPDRRAEAPVASDADENSSELLKAAGHGRASPNLTLEQVGGGMRRAHTIQDFKTSARSSHRSSSPVKDGIFTLKSFMLVLPSDIAGGLAMIS